MTALLEAVGLTKAYAARQSVPALTDVHVSIEPGELIGVVGPSGSGKSTLLHLIGLLDRPTAGVLRVNGADVGSLSSRDLAALRSRTIGFVFQQFHLLPASTALDNVALGLVYTGTAFAERRARAAEALRLVGLLDRVGHRPSQLSGGEQQRVAVARAMVGRPPLLLADEPTGNLDRASGSVVLGLLRDLHAQGHTVVIVTHDQELASRLPRILPIVDGRLVADRFPISG